ncbi:NADP-dependent oxidoreductase [Leifsonia sp. AG29]|uniref:NADP-dependent oxidoreductase n=1 Tax=Leifsonia sp. AG29 TaxID=2598860 RepID=UPI00131A9A2A|nr:NADP-dependent oxidoreductase [Leifsonia sp. AG29]
MAKTHDQTLVVEYDEAGDESVLQARVRPLAPPGPGEVLVQVVAAGINHIDGFIRSGREATWADEPFPRGSGSDFAGIVVSVGDKAFPSGTEVIGHVRAGAQAEYLVVPTTHLVRKPKDVTWEIAGGLYLAGATALATLDELRVGAGDTVVVSAAAGGVGSIEAQLARHAGARVIGTCGDRNFDYLRQVGIKPVRYGEGIADRIREVAPDGVTCFIDNFGQDGRELAAELGVPQARYRSSDDRRLTELALLQDDPDSVARGTDLLARVAELAGRRAFTLLISGFYPLADVAYAYDDLRRLHSRGKIVLGTRPVTTYWTLKARDVQEAGA